RDNNGTMTSDDTWGIFARNWGDEGQCGGSQHYIDRTRFTVRLPPPSNSNPTAVRVLGTSNFEPATSQWFVSPLMEDETGKFVEVVLTIPPPQNHGFIDGELHLQWL